MFIEYVKHEWFRRRTKNPGYSLRAFARSLRMDPATLSSVLRGTRPLRTKTAKKILDGLNVSMTERKKLLLEVVEEKTEQNINQKYTLLKKEIIEMISSWEHDAILLLLQILHFEPTVGAISKRLKIGKEVCVDVLNRLEKLGLIRKENKRWVVKHTHTTTPTDVPNSALRKLHRQYIQKSLVSLRHDHPVERDITGMTMIIAKKKLPEAKKRIQEFRRSLSDFLEDGEKDEIYRLNIQLFPVR